MSSKINSISSVVDSHQNEIYDRFQVKSLFVFGSVAKGTETTDSDVDILVNYEKPPNLFEFLNFREYHEKKILNMRVDLVTEKALKKQLREQIISEVIRVA